MRITFICPLCRYRWLGAILHAEDGVTVEALAKRPYCPVCDCAPPMGVEVENA